MSNVLNPSRNTKNLDFLAALGNTGKTPAPAPAPAKPYKDNASYDNLDGPPRQLLQDGETEF